MVLTNMSASPSLSMSPPQISTGESQLELIVCLVKLSEPSFSNHKTISLVSVSYTHLRAHET